MPEDPKIQFKAESGHSPQRLATILATGLTDDQLKMIGEIAVLWNSAQARFQQFIWGAARWGADLGGLVTADMPPVSLVQLAKNLLAHNIKKSAVVTYGTAVITLFDEVRIARNNTIHGLPVIERKGTEHFQSATAKNAEGALKISTSLVTVGELATLIKDVSVLAIGIEGSIFQFFTLKLIEGGHMSRAFEDENLERATLIELSQIQNRIDGLRLRRSIAGNKSPQPQSSQV